MRKHTKEERLEYKADKKVIKKKMKSIKSQISKSNKEIKKQVKLIRTTETALGKSYYNSVTVKKVPAAQACAKLCGVIQGAESRVKSCEEKKHDLGADLTRAKEELRLRRLEYRAGAIPEPDLFAF